MRPDVCVYEMFDDGDTLDGIEPNNKTRKL